MIREVRLYAGFSLVVAGTGGAARATSSLGFVAIEPTEAGALVKVCSLVPSPISGSSFCWELVVLVPTEVAVEEFISSSGPGRFVS